MEASLPQWTSFRLIEPRKKMPQSGKEEEKTPKLPVSSKSIPMCTLERAAQNAPGMSRRHVTQADLKSNRRHTIATRRRQSQSPCRQAPRAVVRLPTSAATTRPLCAAAACNRGSRLELSAARGGGTAQAAQPLSLKTAAPLRKKLLPLLLRPRQQSQARLYGFAPLPPPKRRPASR